MLLMNPLDSVLGQASKVKILRFLTRSQAELNGREIAKAVKLSHVKCHAALQQLSTHGLVRMRSAGRSLLYRPEMNNVLVKTLLRPLFEAESLLLDKLAGTILREVSKARPVSIVAFGSVVNGNARPDSDFDILIVAADGKSLRRARHAAERAEEKVLEAFGNRLAPILSTRRSFRTRVRGGDSLYAEIARTGRSIYGKSVQEILGNAG